MSESIPRCEKIANYMLEGCTTIREAAEHFGVSKSVVHEEVTRRLESRNFGLYLEVRELLDANWADRSRRGGLACVKKHPEMLERLRPWLFKPKAK